MAKEDITSWDTTEASEGFREKLGKRHQEAGMPLPLSMPDEPLSLQDSPPDMDRRAFREQLPATEEEADDQPA